MLLNHLLKFTISYLLLLTINSPIFAQGGIIKVTIVNQVRSIKIDGQNIQLTNQGEFTYSHRDLYNKIFLLELPGSSTIYAIKFFGNELRLEFNQNKVNYTFQGYVKNKTNDQNLTDELGLIIKNHKLNKYITLTADKNGRYWCNLTHFDQFASLTVVPVKTNTYSVTYDHIQPNGTIYLEKSNGYSGNILGANNQPISNAKLRFRNNLSNPSDANGHFQLTNPTSQFAKNKNLRLEVLLQDQNLTFTNIPHKTLTTEDQSVFYWEFIEDQNHIRVVVPVTNTPIKYRATEQDNPMIDLPIVLKNIRYSFKTDTNGIFYARLMPSVVVPVSQYLDIKPVNLNNIDSVLLAKKNSKLTQTTNIDQKPTHDLQTFAKLISKAKADILLKISRLTVKTKRNKPITTEELEGLSQDIKKFQMLIDNQQRSFKNNINELFTDKNQLQKSMNSMGDIVTFAKEFVTMRENVINQHRRVYFLTLVINIVLFISLIISIWYISRIRRKNIQLNAQNILIDLLIGELQHRVVNGLLAVKSLMNSIADSVDHPPTQTHLKEADDFIQRLMEVSDILDYDFLNDAKSDMMNIDSIRFNVEDISSTIINFYFNDPTVTKPKVIIDIDINEVEKNKFSFIGFIVYELVNNSCKHAFRGKHIPDNPFINIKITSKSKTITLTISDNGRGIPKELFQGGMLNTEAIIASGGFKITQQLVKIFQGNFKAQTVGVHPHIETGSSIECEFKF